MAATRAAAWCSTGSRDSRWRASRTTSTKTCAGGAATTDPDIGRRLQARARYLDDTFYPEVKAVFEIARREKIDPVGLVGSGAGAFGYPQFLPTSYIQHAADGNGDGHISLYDPADAAASCANYLARHGWRPGLSEQEQRAVIWRYNRSDAYIDTVLTLSHRIEEDGASGN